MNIRLGKRFWIGATAIIVVFTAFVVVRNLVHAVKIRRQIAQLDREKRAFEHRIAQDSALLERLRYDDYLEEYAREHYRMQRRDEHVYLIEEN
ncbi:MAG: septum formation initiator family protein [Alistipes sp.]|nr:septum formation initiator family protein [Alistipes sp.]